MGQRVLVLDTGPLMEGYAADEQTRCLVPDQVLAELERHGVSSYEIQSRGLVPARPTAGTTERVRAAAEETGDLDVLSPADLAVLALAVEMEATLVTDDYAVQNVASAMEIKTEAFAQEGIQRTLAWEWYCPACRQHTGDRKGECPVCAAELKRRPRQT